MWWSPPFPHRTDRCSARQFVDELGSIRRQSGRRRGFLRDLVTAADGNIVRGMADRTLIHAVNNLLAVIETQCAVARADPAPDTARRALELIESAAQRAASVVAAERRERDRSSYDLVLTGWLEQAPQPFGQRLIVERPTEDHVGLREERLQHAAA
jgi:hypothetical protein